MAGFVEWAKDLLVSRGALVDSDGGGLGAMVPAEVASALECQEWLSLRFGEGAGSDDQGEWLERLGRLLPANARIAGARPRRTSILRAIDAAAVLDRELAIQNGIYRLPDERQATARYYFFNVQYTVESDETSFGLWTGCLNATANSVVNQPDALLRLVRDEVEDDPAFDGAREEVARLFPQALRLAKPEIQRMAAAIEMNANRRLARDSERIHGYYADLLRQIEKRAARHKGDEQAAAKERDRASATVLDRTAKLEDLARKYALRIRVEPGDVLSVTLPVREIAVRVIRKKVERAARFHWNPILGRLESPWCEGCGAHAHPLYLCDDQAHFLCQGCQRPCAACGRQFCRACRVRCKCGAVQVDRMEQSPGGSHMAAAGGDV